MEIENKPARQSRGVWRKTLKGSVAAAALLAGVGAYTYAGADEPVLSKNNAPGTLTLGQKAVALPDFTDLVQRVKPAVVSVKVTQNDVSEATSEQGDQQGEQQNPFEGTPFDRFFHDFGNQNGQGQGQFRSTPRRVKAQGSGFFISADGYIVTNNHVVANATEVSVTLEDGQEYAAKVIGTDKRTDLALIKVDADRKFPFVTLAKGDTKIGEWIVAMGNPFGLGGTVTAGIVSAEGRDIGEGPYDNFIQIDAPVNRGNSGGPTFNLKGEVIGVNTAIYSPSGGSVGIAFDIPASTVESVIPQLQAKGYVERGFLGVQIQPVTRAIADSLALKDAKGALIAVPQPGSPADKAGLKSGDVITSVNGKDLRDARDLARQIAAIAPGTDVSLSIVRNGQPQSLQLKVGRLQDANVTPASARQNDQQRQRLGLEVAPAAQVQGAGATGLAVLAVDPSGPAAELGFQTGDVILKAGNTELAAPKDLTQALENAKQAGRKNALLLVKNRAGERYVAFPVAVG